ncbi:N-acetylated-alpha-linked acidic dipeptidase 2 isoform X2 [Nematostella vectensis]|uniref:N-acetylated-alpha-linked acidic dipeptidase 2 isoform X2 n=1 Tax=Nematostella vectensis TaxID=45351 RepID=UPI0020776A24|nr:N-acetylated-alpha-linked acidic dipeptidase 2 isoform X2 [Nematostella vectensis]
MSLEKKFFLGIASLLLLVGFIGFIIGYFMSPCTIQKSDHLNPRTTPDIDALHNSAAAQVSNSKLNDTLRYFSSVPRLAGTNGSYQLALYQEKEFKSYGFDNVELKKYEVLLSYPNKPGFVALLYANHTEQHRSAEQERVLDASENHTDRVSPFNAYSPSGDVKGKLVYVNYGREEDFKYLKDNNINVTGKIVIARYGKLFRGGKAQNAERRGAKGLILYSDPADTGGQEKTYPDGMALSPDGVQRGNLWMEKGDPLTPGYPATDGIYRRPEAEVPFPKIPVKPISWEDAEPLLRSLTKGNAPDEWQGGLVTKCKIEMDDSDERNVRVFVDNKLEKRSVHNVIATINGDEEPDRYVILGSHRDAWVFGGVDPSTGQTVLMETARLVGHLRKESWRPRRTIIFASWDAEEYGILGSAEWVEENEKILSSRAVAYINIDSAVTGAVSFRAKSHPLLDTGIFEVTKKVNGIGNSTDNLYEEWKRDVPDAKNEHPSVETIGSGSDYLFFIQRIGIPSIDFRFVGNSSSYPVYHTLHDTYHYVTKFLDPDMRLHAAVTKVALRMLMKLADSRVVPLDVRRLARAIDSYGKTLNETYSDDLAKQSITLKYVFEAISEFKDAAEDFSKYLEKLDTNDAVKVMRANDRLIQLDRAFINTEGLPNRPAIRHLVYAPSVFNLYAGSNFAGITDSIYEAKHNGKDWEQVKKQISMVVHAMRSAVSIFKPLPA